MVSEEDSPSSPRWTRWLSHPQWIWICTTAALLLGLTTIGLGLSADDWLQRQILLGKWPANPTTPLLDFFAFIPASGESRTVMRDSGALGWWADPQLSAQFFRPVTVLTHMLDYRLWPDQFWLQHLHSVLWSCASVAVVCLYLRRTGLTIAVAGLAGLMFAVEDAHSLNMGWIANRNASICMVFGVGSLWLHQRWREEGRWQLAIGSGTCFTLSLLSAEAGIGTLAYLIAWQLVMDRGSWGARLKALIPYLMLVVSWRMLYQSMGYGVQWSDVYIDPGRQPLRFLTAMCERLPLLLSSQWLQLPIDGTNFLEPLGRLLAALAAGMVCIVLLGWLRPVLRESPLARFWFVGMVLSIVPICASFPMDRVLTFTGIGAFALLAMQVEPWLAGARALTSSERLLLILHIPCAALALATRPFLWFGLTNTYISADTLPTDVQEDQILILLQAHDLTGPQVAMKPLIRGDQDDLVSVAMLGPMLADTEVFRVDERTLELRPEGGWLRVPVERLMRSRDRPFELGEVQAMNGYEVQITELSEDGRPLVVRFTFESSLDAPRYRWFAFEDHELIETRPPDLGESKVLPGVLF